MIKEEMRAIEDEETRDSLFMLRHMLMQEESILEEIACKCNSFEEFSDLIKDWFKADSVRISNEKIRDVWKNIIEANEFHEEE